MLQQDKIFKILNNIFVIFICENKMATFGLYSNLFEATDSY